MSFCANSELNWSAFNRPVPKAGKLQLAQAQKSVVLTSYLDASRLEVYCNIDTAHAEFSKLSTADLIMEERRAS